MPRPARLRETPHREPSLSPQLAFYESNDGKAAQARLASLKTETSREVDARNAKLKALQQAVDSVAEKRALLFVLNQDSGATGNGDSIFSKENLRCSVPPCDPVTSAPSVAYCFSYTVIVVTARPPESTPLVVVVIVLPSDARTIVDFAATRPPILTTVS